MALVACTFPLDFVHSEGFVGQPSMLSFQCRAMPTGAELYALPTGHWPMLSEPKRLAEILDEISRGATPEGG